MAFMAHLIFGQGKTKGWMLLAGFGGRLQSDSGAGHVVIEEDSNDV
jgi:hypothetical protein